MKLWRFSDPCNYEYARASRRGSWSGNPSRRVQPLLIEWEPDSDVVGDFTWPGFDSDIIVTERVAGVLRAANVPGFELGPVQMQENSEPGKRRTKKLPVKLPYTGTKLWDLYPTAWATIDADRSTISEVKEADGARHFEVRGVQHRLQTWDQARGALVTSLHPRVEGQGVVVPTAEGIFRLRELPAWVFCTDDVRRLIEDHEFTNVCFLEMGDVLSPR